MQFQVLFKTLIIPQNFLYCLNKTVSLDKVITVTTRKTKNMECWVSKDPQDQPTLQLRQAGVGTEMEGRQASGQGHTLVSGSVHPGSHTTSHITDFHLQPDLKLQVQTLKGFAAQFSFCPVVGSL